MKLWRLLRLRRRPGKYLNSPAIESWQVCGVIRAKNEDAAAARAFQIVGRGAVVRVEEAEEWYRPPSLLED